MKALDKEFRFNSKLVRLKETDKLPMSVVLLQFQFQTGAIKRPERLEELISLIKCFNSKLVRLKVGARFAKPRTEFFVSIPNWCD